MCMDKDWHIYTFKFNNEYFNILIVKVLLKVFDTDMPMVTIAWKALPCLSWGGWRVHQPTPELDDNSLKSLLLPWISPHHPLLQLFFVLGSPSRSVTPLSSRPQPGGWEVSPALIYLTPQQWPVPTDSLFPLLSSPQCSPPSDRSPFLKSQTFPNCKADHDASYWILWYPPLITRWGPNSFFWHKRAPRPIPEHIPKLSLAPRPHPARPSCRSFSALVLLPLSCSHSFNLNGVNTLIQWSIHIE